MCVCINIMCIPHIPHITHYVHIHTTHTQTSRCTIHTSHTLHRYNHIFQTHSTHIPYTQHISHTTYVYYIHIKHIPYTSHINHTYHTIYHSIHKNSAFLTHQTYHILCHPYPTYHIHYKYQVTQPNTHIPDTLYTIKKIRNQCICKTTSIQKEILYKFSELQKD